MDKKWEAPTKQNENKAQSTNRALRTGFQEQTKHKHTHAHIEPNFISNAE